MASIGYTQYARDQFLNVFRGISITAPAAMYAAAITTNPANMDVSDMVEVSSVTHPEYARQQVGFDAPVTDTTFRKLLNSLEEVYANANTAWGNIVAIALFDAPTGGNCWYVHASPTAKQIDPADALRILQGQLSIKIGNAV